MDSRKSQLRWKCLHHRSTRFKFHLFCRLCTLFEEDGRFVKFINRTGKQIVCWIQYSDWSIRKTSSSIKQILQTRQIFLVSWYRHRHQLWFHLEVFRWFFLIVINNIISISSHCLGDSSTIFEDYFLLLPESYNSARSNQLQFHAEYVDEGSGDMEITFNEEVRLRTVDVWDSDKKDL